LIMLPGYGQRVAFVKAYLSLQSHFLWYWWRFFEDTSF
jgi:hypothetical protein